MQAVCPVAFCHDPEQPLQKYWFCDDDTDPAAHALHVRSLVAVPFTWMYSPAEQFCQYAHTARPAADVNVDGPHAVHTVLTIPSHPLVYPVPAAQLLHPAHVRSAVVLPRNPK